ncbi:MAG TPA: alpha/beta hydrolase [Burkholderiaceae bacterium]|nr:alpha/beta hydrolase [Burkholderiaceae bacterium]
MSRTLEFPHSAATPPLVLLHGLCSTPREFGLIALPLRNRGVRLITPTVAGYSLDAGRGRTSWRHWLDAASAAISEAAPSGPVVLGGLCAGALLAASFALEMPHRVAGLVLMSATFDFDGWAQTRWRHLRRLGYALGLDRWIRVTERDPFGIKNERMRAWVAREMQQRGGSAAGPSTLPLWAIREVDRLKDHVAASLHRLTHRTLMLHARDDEVCTLAAAQRSMQALAAEDKRLVVLDNSYHMITIDNDRQRVSDELREFTRAAAPTTRPATRPIVPTEVVCPAR